VIETAGPEASARVRQTKVGSVNGSTTSVSVSFDVQPKVGSLVVISVTIAGADVDLSTVTDNQVGNSYAFAAGETGGLSNEGGFFTGVIVGSSGTFTITVDPPGTGTVTTVVISEVIDWDGVTQVEDS